MTSAIDSNSALAENPKGERAYHIGIALAVLSTVAVILRLLARWKTKAKFAMDDLLIAISLLPCYVMVILTYYGKHLHNIGLGDGLTRQKSGERRAPRAINLGD